MNDAPDADLGTDNNSTPKNTADKHGQERRARAFLLLLVLAGWVTSFTLMVRSWSLLAHASRADGIVVEQVAHDSRGSLRAPAHSWTTARVRFRESDDRAFEFQTWNRPLATHIEVFYHPGDESHAIANVAETWIDPLLPAAGVSVLAALLLRFGRRRRG